MIPLPPGFDWKPSQAPAHDPARPLSVSRPTGGPVHACHAWFGPRLEMVRWPLLLRFRSRGRLLPWLGPALRGLLAFSLKRAVCFHPPAVRDTLWKHCEGCPRQRQCPMGATFEPPDTLADRGRHQAPRPVVLSPEMNHQPESWPGMELRASLLLTGSKAMAEGKAVLETLHAAGRERGLGGDGATFDLDLEGSPSLMALGPVDLPEHPDRGTGKVPRVSIELTSPLFLRGSGMREHLEKPTFSDLFNAAFRAVEHQLNTRGLGVTLDMAAFRASAANVQGMSGDWSPFTQGHYSSRGATRYGLRGVQGGASFGQVPEGFLPWLVWGGRLHAGDLRVSGAGGWRVVQE